MTTWTMNRRIKRALAEMRVPFMAAELADAVNHDGLGDMVLSNAGIVRKAHVEGWIECTGRSKKSGPGCGCKMWRSLI